MSEPLKITPAEMQIGDVVCRVGERHPYGTCTVKQIKDGLVHFFRPYTHTSGFVDTAGTICYIGFEEFSIYASTEVDYYLLERMYLK